MPPFLMYARKAGLKNTGTTTRSCYEIINTSTALFETLGQLAVENGNQCIAKWSSKAKSLSMELRHPCRTNNKGRNRRNMKVFSMNKSLSYLGRCERLYLGGSVLLNLTFDSRFVLNFQKIFPLDDVDMKRVRRIILSSNSKSEGDFKTNQSS